MKFGAVLALMASAAYADGHEERNPRPSQAFQIESAEVNMRYIEETEQVEFIVTLNDGGWFGLLPGDSGMAQNADILFFSANGDDSYFEDYTSIGYQPPQIDAI